MQGQPVRAVLTRCGNNFCSAPVGGPVVPTGAAGSHTTCSSGSGSRSNASAACSAVVVDLLPVHCVQQEVCRPGCIDSQLLHKRLVCGHAKEVTTNKTQYGESLPLLPMLWCQALAGASPLCCCGRSGCLQETLHIDGGFNDELGRTQTCNRGVEHLPTLNSNCGSPVRCMNPSCGAQPHWGQLT